MSYIKLEEAQAMIANYQSVRPTLVANPYSADVLPLNITLPAAEVQALLDQDGCDAVRIYLAVDGQDDNPLITTILVGVDKNNQDIIPNEDYILINKGTRCPVSCPPPSVLTP